MRPCHICERITKKNKFVPCSSCQKIYCFACIYKHFPQTVNELPKTNFTKCFSCNKSCKCLKCNIAQNIVVHNNAVIQPQASVFGRSLVSEQQPIADLGLFRGKKVSDLPLYLQRIYLKKKVLYSMHQISSPANDKNVELQNEQGQRQNVGWEEKGMKEIDQSVLPQEQPLKQNDPNPKHQINENDEQEQQVEDYQSQYPSRRAEHLQNNQNSAIDQQLQASNQVANREAMDAESMMDQNGQSRSKRGELVSEQRKASKEGEQINQE